MSIILVICLENCKREDYKYNYLSQNLKVGIIKKRWIR